MAERLKVLLHMHDLTGAGERRTTLMLALLVVGILLLPLSPSAAQIARPDAVSYTHLTLPTIYSV